MKVTDGTCTSKSNHHQSSFSQRNCSLIYNDAIELFGESIIPRLHSSQLNSTGLRAVYNPLRQTLFTKQSLPAKTKDTGYIKELISNLRNKPNYKQLYFNESIFLDQTEEYSISTSVGILSMTNRRKRHMLSESKLHEFEDEETSTGRVSKRARLEVEPIDVRSRLSVLKKSKQIGRLRTLQIGNRQRVNLIELAKIPVLPNILL